MVRRAEGALLQSVVIDRDAPHSLSVQICAGLRDLILNGSLKAGARLPATRILAKECGVARATIVESFDQLVAEGLLETRVGAGTFVSVALDAERPAMPAEADRRAIALDRLAQPMAVATGRFATRLPHKPRPFTTAMPAFDAFPMAQWSRLSAKHWRQPRDLVLGYPDFLGYEPLRRAIAAHLRANRGIDCDWRQVFVVAGAQQAFQLIAATLIDPGEKVWFENPGAIGARNILVAAGADLVPVPVDEAGLDVGRGLELAPRFKLAFVTPSHQQPLGAKMSLERRFALLSAAEDCDGWIIEDDWDGEFCFSGRPLPTLKGVDASGRVIYVGTFSKTLFPSLRLGFLLAPPALSDHFSQSLEAFSPGTPTAPQAILADFIAEGHFATHIRRMRKLYAERYQTLLDAVREHLSEWLEIVPTTTGLHTVALLRPGLDADAVTLVAAENGLTVVPIARFCIEPIERQGLVLGFSGFSPAQIRSAALQLRAVLKGARAPTAS
ncbi:MAG: PLP-dependent aminotransferase family protein [Elsteraceae bacterium]